jgi:hypothetical protein
MPATSPATPQIASEGPPPERHADRVVDEISRWLIAGSARVRDDIYLMFKVGPSDGNPKAQARLAERLRRVGRGVITEVHLTPGKRGRFALTFAYWTGFDPERDKCVETADALPVGRVWLAYVIKRVKGEGGGQYSKAGGAAFLVTHHALSRLAQRCGARTPGDLIDGLTSMANGIVPILEAEAGVPRSGRWRVEIEGGATAVLEPHKTQPVLVVVTVLDKDMAR